MTRLRIATWNVNSGALASNGLWRFAAADFGAHLIAGIADHRLELCLLQEFPLPSSAPNFFLDMLRDETALTHVASVDFADSHLVKDMRIGLVIACAHPIFSKQSAFLPTPDIMVENHHQPAQRLHKRPYLSVQTALDGITITVVNLHLPPFRRLRRDPGDAIFDPLRDALLTYFNGLCDPFIIAGDINTSSLDNVLPDFSQHLGCRDVITSSTRNDGSKTDSINLSFRLRSHAADAVRTLSDHHLCRSDISLSWHACEPSRSATRTYLT